MAHLSTARIANAPLLRDLELLNRGKVRDTYKIDDDHLLPVTTDAISIFDIVLNATVPDKGRVLTAMSHFWFKNLSKFGIPTHLVAAGADIDKFLPEHLRGNPEIQSRAMVVNRLNMSPVEFIARGYLTGSGLAEYKKNWTICGHMLVPNHYQDGDQLPFILDTPTTKAEEGHDETINFQEIRENYPTETFQLFEIYQLVSGFARERGIIFADTKLEFGRDKNGKVVLGDEVATPDSSRWWAESAWIASQKTDLRKAPVPLDKQLVRQFGIEQGINILDPKNPEDVKKAQGVRVPDYLIRATAQTYRYIFWRLFNSILEEYFSRELGVSLPRKKKNIAIVFGSESDIETTGLRSATVKTYGATVHVISCHRNPDFLERFAESGCGGADVVIAAGGKTFAMPGMLDAWLNHFQYDIPVIGVALGEPGSRELEAAKLSIEELPGQPVIMDEIRGRVYTGPAGLGVALSRVAFDELPPPKPRVKKDPRLNVNLEK